MNDASYYYISDKLVSNDRVEAFIYATFSLYYTRKVINLFYTLSEVRYFISFEKRVSLIFLFHI